MDTCTQETILRAINLLATAVRKEVFQEGLAADLADTEFCRRMVAAVTAAYEAYPRSIAQKLHNA